MKHFSSIGAFRSPIAVAMDGLGCDGGGGEGFVDRYFRAVSVSFGNVEVVLSGSDAKTEGWSRHLECVCVGSVC